MEALPSLKVLVVEDDPLQREACEAFLGALGQRVVTTATGDDAIALFEREEPDLVLMDVLLPTIDGFETTRRLRAQCGERWVPIIYLTVLDSSARLIEGLEAGGDDYLVKPVSVDILEAKLRSVIRTLSLYRQIEESRDDLKRANITLTRANRELDTFAYSVAHDLKAPLRAIDGYRGLLMEDYAERLAPEAKGYLERIGLSVAHMNTLIDDMLVYSRIERSTQKTTTLELKPLIESALQFYQRELDASKAHVTVTATGSLSADRRGIELALRNLIGNAVKFVASEPSPSIEIGFEQNADRQHLWVSDNGIGFDMRHSNRIFDIFQRLHPSDRYPGTGIGLAIVRKAIERMGGRTWAESSPGKGACFHLEWPA